MGLATCCCDAPAHAERVRVRGEGGETILVPCTAASLAQTVDTACSTLHEGEGGGEPGARERECERLGARSVETDVRAAHTVVFVAHTPPHPPSSFSNTGRCVRAPFGGLRFS